MPKDEAQVQDRTEELGGLAARTLSGDIRAAMLHRIEYEHGKKPWKDRSEAEQRQTINQITEVAETLVRETVKLVAGFGFTQINATLDGVGRKKGVVKAVLLASANDPARHALSDAEGSVVTLLLADSRVFMGERSAPAISKDQPDLPIAEAAPEPDPETYWVIGTEVPDDSEGAEEGATIAPRYPSIIEALVEAGADFLEPREMHSSGWVMKRWGVLIQGGATDTEGTREPDQFRVFSTHSAADQYCQDAKKAQQEAALAGLIASGETTTQATTSPQEAQQRADEPEGRKARKVH